MHPKPTIVQRNALLCFIVLTYLLSWWTVPFLLFVGLTTLLAIATVRLAGGRLGQDPKTMSTAV